VVAVGRGTQAAPLLEQEHFDLLLTDIAMPEMDGIELARHCNRVSPGIEVMLITGFLGAALRAGASMPRAKILSKPFHLKGLAPQVERLFAKESFGELK
jgi:two-component system cell cycle response regulator CpdR